MFTENLKKSDCCGCMACANICGKSAITMKHDKCGFYYPIVDETKCVNCGLCQKVCPMEDTFTGVDASPDIYALRNRDPQILKGSSSGGMFTLLAKWVISQNGVVYGVAFDKDYKVLHMRAQSMEEASAFCTSKYVESDLSKVYVSLSQDLKSGKTVLLTGTPCQIAGVQKFLRTRHIPTDNLYTCDNICHGVPSRMLWKDYLKILKEKYIAKDDRITGINMRSKRVSWKKQVMDVTLEKGNLESVMRHPSFNRFFLSLYGNRPSCFHCHYTSYKRPGDFTLGDFWNVENAGVTFDVEGGVNLVLVNTPKGQKLFDQLKEEADYQSVSKKASWQPHLEYSAKPPAKQAAFWHEYTESNDKEMIMRKYMQGSFLTKVIRKVTPFLRKTGLYGFAGKMYKTLLVRKK